MALFALAGQPRRLSPHDLIRLLFLGARQAGRPASRRAAPNSPSQSESSLSGKNLFFGRRLVLLHALFVLGFHLLQLRFLVGR